MRLRLFAVMFFAVLVGWGLPKVLALAANDSSRVGTTIGFGGVGHLFDDARLSGMDGASAEINRRGFRCTAEATT